MARKPCVLNVVECSGPKSPALAHGSWAWVMAAYAKFKALQGQSSKKSALNIVWGYWTTASPALKASYRWWARKHLEIAMSLIEPGLVMICRPGWRQNPGCLPVCEDASRLVREKTRARLLQSSRFHDLCRFISLEGWRAWRASSRALSDGWAEIAWFLIARRYHGGSPKTVPILPPASSSAPEITPWAGKMRNAAPKE